MDPYKREGWHFRCGKWVMRSFRGFDTPTGARYWYLPRIPVMNFLSSGGMGCKKDRGAIYPYPQLKGQDRSVGVRIGLQCGGENREPVIVNGTGRLTNWPSFLNGTGKLKAHNWADWLHHPCLPHGRE